MKYKYELWQLRLTDKNRKKMFMSFKVLGEMGIRPQIGDYELIYSGEVGAGDTYEAIAKVFRIFNINIPADFNGHSASVSDVIKINGRYYYIDPFGFKEVEGLEVTKGN
jgi:hypothetical protein